jgi:hypothetical protein
MTSDPAKPLLLRPYAMFFIAALSFLWIRSYWRSDAALIIAPSDKLQTLTSKRGHLQLMLSTIALGDPWSWSMQVHSSVPTPRSSLGLEDINQMLDIPAADKTFEKFGFELSGKRLLNGSAIIIGLPHAVPILLLSILPIRSLLRWRRWRQWTRRKLCKGCGYDLRASTDRCPECGRAIEAMQTDDLVASGIEADEE